MLPSAGSWPSRTGATLRDPLGHWGRGPQRCSAITAPRHTTDPGWQCQCAARGASGTAGLNKTRPNAVPGAGVCLQGAQKVALTASTFCHPHHPTPMPCSSGGDNLLSEPSPLSGECLCPPALSCVERGQNPPCGSHHSSPARALCLCPLWDSCAMSWELCEGTHVPTEGYRGCRSGVEHPTSCSGTVLGSCCRKAGITSQSQKGRSPLGECQRWDRMGTGSSTA